MNGISICHVVPDSLFELPTFSKDLLVILISIYLLLYLWTLWCMNTVHKATLVYNKRHDTPTSVHSTIRNCIQKGYLTWINTKCNNFINVCNRINIENHRVTNHTPCINRFPENVSVYTYMYEHARKTKYSNKSHKTWTHKKTTLIEKYGMVLIPNQMFWRNKKSTIIQRHENCKNCDIFQIAKYF